MTTFDAHTHRRSVVQFGSLAVGAVFLLVGILGFIPGITTDYDTLTWAGHHTDAKLLGVFQVSVLHNIVHLLFGVVGLLAARTAVTARGFLLGGGVIYLLLWLYGLLIDRSSDANFVPVNNADNWLHLGLGAGMVLLGLILPRATGTRHGSARPGTVGGPSPAA
ncbi:DUF4383 domain-containing protein [Nocardia blacklockiae]|uniref:DUF4383 domain-containing protein n=1 Tax=Nocardia blacklockiae TaxID=480036 RepID=UPI0018946F3B|nr:DUF4383 domain-containing protein [Nocardia blacklockiae]MBF6175053.1 DUF4383 domain-containing protein [Nocardia blacklockiae]